MQKLYGIKNSPGVVFSLPCSGGNIHTHREKRIKSSPGVVFSLPCSGAVAV